MPKKPGERKGKTKEKEEEKSEEKTDEKSDEDSEYETEEEDEDEDAVAAEAIVENQEEDRENEEDEECPYMPMGKRMGVNKIVARIDKDDEDNDDDYHTGANIFVQPEERITSTLMTKYERVRLLSTRTVQLEGGAKPMIKNTEGLSAKQIARLELQHKKIPIKVIRPLPNGKKEIWYVRELTIKK